jgi:hypothetical protein
MSPNIIPKHYSMENAASELSCVVVSCGIMHWTTFSAQTGLMVERDVNSCLVSSNREVAGIISSRDFVQKVMRDTILEISFYNSALSDVLDCCRPKNSNTMLKRMSETT